MVVISDFAYYFASSSGTNAARRQCAEYHYNRSISARPEPCAQAALTVEARNENVKKRTCAVRQNRTCGRPQLRFPHRQPGLLFLEPVLAEDRSRGFRTADLVCSSADPVCSSCPYLRKTAAEAPAPSALLLTWSVLPSKSEFAEGHSRGPRTASLDLIFLEPVCLKFSCSPFSCSLLHWSIFGS